jgi:peptidyl-prolyl cis-trans isomerase D
MLEFIRSHRRLMQILLALFLVPGLGLVGIQGFRNFFDDSANVATVNGQPITRQEYDAALRDQTDRMRQMLGANYDAKSFDTPEMRRALLDSLVQRRLLADHTQRANLTVTDNALRAALLDIPAIAQLKKPDGSIDAPQYTALLAQQGMTVDQFEQRVRFSLANQQIPNNLEQSAFVPVALAQRLTDLSEQRREVRALEFNAASYAGAAKPTDAQLHAYYDAHQAQFQTPETATVQYIVLSQSELAAGVQPSDADMHAYYDAHQAQFQTGGKVRASHILLSVAPNASAAERDKARARATELLKQVRAAPSKFADIARQESQDPGSAPGGGDLGFFGRGMMLKPFETAAFGLAKGQLSDVVQTDAGYHIIMVTDVKPGTTRSFDEAKSDIAMRLKTEAAAKQYATDVDLFTKLVQDQNETLQPVADKLGLALRTADLTRNAPAPGAAQGNPVNDPKVRNAVFTDDVLKKKYNTDPIDIGGGTLVAARVVRYKPAAVRPFAEVTADVRSSVLAQQSADLARKAGETRLAELRKSKSTDGFAPAITVSRNDAQKLSPAVVGAVFKADANALPQYVGVDRGADGYAIYRVERIVPGPAPDAQRVLGAQQQLAQMSAQADTQAWLGTLRAAGKVKISGNVNRPSDGDE